MNTQAILPRALSLLVAAGTMLGFADTALASCDVPERLHMQDPGLPSWPALVTGSWSAHASNGISDTLCWSKDVDNNNPQVLFTSGGDWYLAFGPDCEMANISLVYLLGASSSADPTKDLDFIRSVRTMTLELAADDGYYTLLDDVIPLAEVMPQTLADPSGFFDSQVVTYDIKGGEHSLDIYAWDVFGTVAAMASSIEIEGCTGKMLTGTDDWQYDTSDFPNAPQSTGNVYDVDAEVGVYHNPPGDLDADGAQYVWWSPNATDLEGARFFLDFYVE